MPRGQRADPTLRDEFGDRLRYVFRHRPKPGSDIARRAAELVGRAPDPEGFWAAHAELMTRSETLTEDDLRAVGSELGLARQDSEEAEEAARRARARVDADVKSAPASGVMFTPTFFSNGSHYDGAVGRELPGGCDAGHARSSRPRGRAGLRQLAASASVLLLLATLPTAPWTTREEEQPAMVKPWHPLPVATTAKVRRPGPF